MPNDSPAPPLPLPDAESDAKPRAHSTAGPPPRPLPAAKPHASAVSCSTCQRLCAADATRKVCMRGAGFAGVGRLGRQSLVDLRHEVSIHYRIATVYWLQYKVDARLFETNAVRLCQRTFSKMAWCCGSQSESSKLAGVCSSILAFLPRAGCKCHAYRCLQRRAGPKWRDAPANMQSVQIISDGAARSLMNPKHSKTALTCANR